MTPDEDYLVAHELHLRFENIAVLLGVSLRLKPGEVVAVVGRSGSGKSVFLKVISGLLTPDSGWVQANGHYIQGAPHPDGEIALVFQQGALLDELTVWENIGLRQLETGNHNAAEIFMQVTKMGMAVGLAERDLQLYPHVLSGGMRKKVSIARALFQQPKVILYDEPTAGLDPAAAGMIDRLILSMNHTFGHGAIIVTHDLNTLERLQPRILLLHDGTFVFEGDYNSFLNTDDVAVRAFLGR